MSKPEFLTVNLIISEKGKKALIREETISVENIDHFRKWHNKGNQGLDESEPMTQITLKKSIAKKSTSKVILVNNDYDDLKGVIG